nr:MarR family transcriptional regulator [Nocardioides perillae]
MRLRRRLAAERQPGNDHSLTAMAVLAGLLRHGELTVGDLAARERVQPPSMTRTVTALEAEGLVARRPSETDGRQVLVALTAAGRETVLADRRRRDAWLAQRLGELTPDQRATLRAAAPILAALAEED